MKILVSQVAARFLLVVDEGPEDHFQPQFASPMTDQEVDEGAKNLMLSAKISASPCVAIQW